MNRLHQIMHTQLQDNKQEVPGFQGVKLENDRSYFTFSECHIKEEPEDKQMLLSGCSELQDTSNTEWNLHVETDIQNGAQGVQIQKVKFEKDDFCLEKIEDTHGFETTSSSVYEVDLLDINRTTGLRTVKQEEEGKYINISENMHSNFQGNDKIYVSGKEESNCNDQNYENNILVETVPINPEIEDHAQYRMYSPLEDTNVTTEKNNSHVENNDFTLENKFMLSYDLKSEKEERFLDESDINMENNSSLIDRYNDNIAGSCTKCEESPSKITDTEVKIENNGINTDKCCVKANDFNFKNPHFGIEPMDFPIVTAEPSIAGHLNTFREETEAVWQPVVRLRRLPDNIFEDGYQVYKITQNSRFHPEKRCTLKQLKSCDQNDWRVSAKAKPKKRNLLSRHTYQGIPRTDNLFISGKGDGKFTDSDTLSENQPTDNRADLGTFNMSNQGLHSVESMRQQVVSNNINRPHKCNVCGKRFRMLSYLRTHMRSHSTERPYLCDVCGKAFNSLSQAKYHMTSHSSVRPYQCDVCGKAFKRPSGLRTHMRSHSTERPYLCDVCGKAFNSLSHVKYHMTSHSSVRPYQCDVCGKAFKYMSNVRSHKISHSTRRPHECNVCAKAFKTLRTLTQHLTSHSTERPHECNVCGKRFKVLSILRSHIMTSHSTERPHECNVCSKRFKTTSCLGTHMTCHSTERPHRCDVCGKMYKTTSALASHMTCHRTESPHECNVCGKMFKTTSCLKTHMISHSTGHTHQCNVCGEIFQWPTLLRQHMNDHSIERPHQCIVCGKRFKKVHALRNHMACHSTERPHQCDLCGKRFKSSSNLRKHMICHSTERPHQCNVCGKRFKTKFAFGKHEEIHNVRRWHQCNMCDKTFKNSEYFKRHVISHSISHKSCDES